MSRLSIATPCPSDPHLVRPFRLSDLPDNYDDATGELEYTTELKARVRQAIPRKIPRQRHHQAPRSQGFDIFEDGNPSVEPSKPAASRRASILSHPAQKPNLRRNSITAPPVRRRVSGVVGSSMLDLSFPNRLDAHGAASIQEDRGVTHYRPGVMEKNARRRTIYVPSEDTTVMTIHPGASSHRYARQKSPDFGLDLVTLSEEETEGLKPAIRQKKESRKSFAVPPKRPLKASRDSLVPNLPVASIPGSQTGKENVPPGKLEPNAIKPRCFSVLPNDKSSINTNRRMQSSHPRGLAAKPRRISMAAGERPSTMVSVETAQEIPKSVHWNSPSRSFPIQKAVGMSHDGSFTPPQRRSIALNESLSPYHPTKSPPAALRRRQSEAIPQKRRALLDRSLSTRLQESFPPLPEDLARPEMYEDHWLEYQEIALTQLINTLFASIEPPEIRGGPQELRKRLLSLYQSPSMSLLYKRLQASLAYGALKAPKGLVPSLKDDVGLREKFLSLLLDTYHPSCLKAALETVTGREVTICSRLSAGMDSATKTEQQLRRERKSLDSFLNAILIRNDDAVKLKNGIGTIGSIAKGQNAHEEDFGSPVWSWRRTMLRVMMLILLLDAAKSQDLIAFCIFLPSSKHKATTSVLQELSKLLFPSVGDITKPLGHLNYHVRHTQPALDEYRYHVGNIATDMRDGILLTRLVELLLYPDPPVSMSNDTTVTTTLPDGEVLTSDLNQRSQCVLSQHLKLPCASHASKIYNVQIALSGMQAARGFPAHAARNISAEDIVNGHREKTLSLLWSLMGKWGVTGLVDWREIERETDRFESQAARDGQLGIAEDPPVPEMMGERKHSGQFETLLRKWASAIGRGHGLSVTNLTTSFADNKVFEAIVDEYLPFCSDTSNTCGSPRQKSSSGPKNTVSLTAKLKTIGCSATFISLFAPDNSSSFRKYSIPSSDFTLITLAFFASRLLPLRICYRAAATIQRVYRLRLRRRELTKRVALMRLAAHCATVVRTREKVVGAAVVLQRAWRGVLERRIQNLVGDVVKFQSFARGWRVRKGTNTWRRGLRKTMRVRGGW